jgi:DNA-binding transcriptional MerR regulator
MRRGKAMRHGWRIGEVAREYGLNPRTLRYYEAIGLLPAPRRTPAGYRLYEVSHREHLRFIVKARAIGLTLAEIRDVVSLHNSGDRPCAYVLTIVNDKLAAADRQLTALAAFRQELVALREEARETRHGNACVCGIIEQHEMTTSVSR